MKSRFSASLEADTTPSDVIVANYRLWLGNQLAQEESLHLPTYRGGEEEFLLGCKYCASSDPLDRSVGCTLLGQLGWSDRTFLDETVDTLIPLLNDPELEVRVNAAYALGHRSSLRAIEPLLLLVRHQEARLRGAAISGLSGLDDLRAVNALIEFSRDSDEHNRSWAMFGLGTMTELDTPELREALWNGHRDGNAEIRGEAFIGLARRGDQRVMSSLIQELGRNFSGVWPVEAAELMARPELVPALKKLRESLCAADELAFGRQFSDAIAACENGAE